MQASEIQDNSIDGGEIVDNSVLSSDLGTITTRSATSAASASGAVGSASVNCLAGEEVISGGNDMSTTVEVVVASRKSGANGWAVFGVRVALVPLCPFVRSYLRRHPEQADLVAARAR